VVFKPATADRSLCTQGTRTARTGAGGAAGPPITSTVCRPGSRPDPSGPTPAVTVTRSLPMPLSTTRENWAVIDG